MATGVFVKFPVAKNKLVCVLIHSHITLRLKVWAVSPQLMVAKRMCFPPLPNQMLKIWFTAFINGITLRSAKSIYSN